MKTYKTSDIAQIIGIHPNTVRLYEAYELIPKTERKKNGYRVFTDFHIEQFKLARIAFEVEVLQNGLRKKAVEIIKLSAKKKFDEAICLAEDYLQQVRKEQINAEEAIEIVKEMLSDTVIGDETANLCLTRKEAADYLQITIDTLRNWELNGLLRIKRKKNGYRIYTEKDAKRLKIIRSLRCANYSLTAILRMLSALSRDPKTNLKMVIDTPQDDEDIVSACDNLLTSLRIAEKNMKTILAQLYIFKKDFR
ncbi:transcriptional regulator MerR family [Clostridium aceticum]|uniref:Transcriptional regulator MerR family n=1 Tax=Clostridium aceticum TaxID=84022 RepID=A0A0D8I9R9_9CLOT|nr:MerR family transcriptional regulator [Clostridium aceticum]AKL96073.1 transcriptional regulator MerR family [Clostridium aceticum]KJF27003.1 MerR family transcriptional regulator [Clostridium aceticum]